MITYVTLQLVLILFLHLFVIVHLRASTCNGCGIRKVGRHGSSFPSLSTSNFSEHSFPNIPQGELLEFIEQELVKLKEQIAIAVDFQVLGVEKGLDSASELLIGRTILETFRNVANHSRATELTVRLIFTRHHVELCIRDNGVGFALPLHNKPGGISRMRKLASVLNAELDITSLPSSGTLVRILLPQLKP